MLTHHLQRHFASIHARLVVRTNPGSALSQIAVREDAYGQFFELRVPHLSRCGIQVLDQDPRRRILVLRLMVNKRRTTLLVQGGRKYRLLRATKRVMEAFRKSRAA
jgi:hypothetical protein